MKLSILFLLLVSSPLCAQWTQPMTPPAPTPTPAPTIIYPVYPQQTIYLTPAPVVYLTPAVRYTTVSHNYGIFGLKTSSTTFGSDGSVRHYHGFGR